MIAALEDGPWKPYPAVRGFQQFAAPKCLQHDLSQTDDALRLLDGEIEKAGGATRVHQARIYASKGL